MKTQRVRIKVAINGEGQYCGIGWTTAKESDPNDTIYESITGDIVREYWITADVPVPTTADEIKGSIEP